MANSILGLCIRVVDSNWKSVRKVVKSTFRLVVGLSVAVSGGSALLPHIVSQRINLNSFEDNDDSQLQSSSNSEYIM